MAPRRLPRAVREQQILDAAVVIFSRQGFHEAAVDDIAARAEISKPMVYSYVGSKEELFAACIRREGLRLIEALAAAAGRGNTPDEKLWWGVRAFFGFVASHRDGWTVLYTRARGQEPFAEVIVSLRARMLELVAGMYAEAGAPDPYALAHAAVGAAESFADWIIDHPERDPETTATRLVSALWSGARAAVGGGLDTDGARAGHGEG